MKLHDIKNHPDEFFLLIGIQSDKNPKMLTNRVFHKDSTNTIIFSLEEEITFFLGYLRSENTYY